MSRPLSLMLAAGFLCLTSSALAEGFFQVSETPLPLEVVVDFENDLDQEDLTALSKAVGFTVSFNSEFSDDGEHLAKIRVGDEATLSRVLDFFKKHEQVEEVERNHVYRATWTPNDPMYKNQWHMDMIKMEQAWGKARGRGVVVAVIDTGVSSGQGKLKQVEDLKDTGFVPGYNFVGDNAWADDDHAHGTHVAGTIAQSTDNGTGVSGIAFEAKIMPIKVLDKYGRGYVSDIADGIRWAADNGADVINMSLGGPLPSLVMAKAVLYARSKGVVVVCAAGNSGRKGVSFPAAYPGAIAVSALGPDEKLAFYSSWGRSISVTAPGGDTRVDLNKDGIADGVLQNTIATADPTRQGYFPFQGTSMASPHVAGVAALIVSQGVTNPAAVERVLRKTATPKGDAEKFGAGLINADAAVSRVMWNSGFLRMGLALILSLLAVWHARRKKTLQPGSIGLAFALGLIPAACGLFFLRSFEVGMPYLFVVSRPVAEWPGALLGMSWHLNILVGSLLPALIPAILLLGSKKLRPWAAGFAIGFAAYLLSLAIDGSVNVRYMPGYGLLDRLWLFGNGMLALLIGRLSIPKR